MTQYEIIKECRRLLKLNGGLTVSQLGLLVRCGSQKVSIALRLMGDAYIDRWIEIKGKFVAVYELMDKPEDCPKPTKERKNEQLARI